MIVISSIRRSKSKVEEIGKTLAQIKKEFKNKFSLKSTLMIVDQAISIISQVHERGYLHLNLNMDTIAVGAEHMNKYIYITGLGQAQNIQEEEETMLLKQKSPNEFSALQLHNGNSYSK